MNNNTSKMDYRKGKKTRLRLSARRKKLGWNKGRKRFIDGSKVCFVKSNDSHTNRGGNCSSSQQKLNIREQTEIIDHNSMSPSSEERGLNKQKNDDLPSTCSAETSEPPTSEPPTSETPPSTSTAETAVAPPPKKPRLEVDVPPDEVEVLPSRVDLLDMTVEIVKSEPVDCEPEVNFEEVTLPGISEEPQQDDFTSSEESEPEKTNCRLCMYNDGTEPIFDNDAEENHLALKIMYTMPSLRVEENDGFSKVVCVDCAMLVGTFYDFKLQCEKTDITLRAATKKYQIPIKISRMKEEREASSACAEFKNLNIRIEDTLRTFYELMDSVKSFEENLPSFGGKRSRRVRCLRSTSRGSKTRGFRGASKSTKRGSASTRRGRRGRPRGCRGRRGASKMSDDALALNYSNTLSHNVHSTMAQVTGGKDRIPIVSETSSHSSNTQNLLTSCVRVKTEVEDIQEPSSNYDSKEDVSNITIPHLFTPDGLRGMKTYSRRIDNKQNISVTDTTGTVLSDDDIKNPNSTVTDDSDKVPASNKGEYRITSVTDNSDKVLPSNKGEYRIASVIDDSDKVPADNKGEYRIESVTDDSDKVPADNKGEYRIASVTDDSDKVPANNKGEYRIASVTDDSDKVPADNKGEYRIASVTDDSDKVPANNKGEYRIASVTDDSDKVPANNKGEYRIASVTDDSDKVPANNKGEYRIASVTDDSDKVPADNKGEYRIASVTYDSDKVPADNKGEYRIASVTDDSDKVPADNKGEYRIASVTDDSDKVPADNKGEYRIASVTDDSDKVPADNKGEY